MNIILTAPSDDRENLKESLSSITDEEVTAWTQKEGGGSKIRILERALVFPWAQSQVYRDPEQCCLAQLF